MKIDRKFNELTFKEYFYYIENHKKYTDFNTLGLYRSLDENDGLDVEQKIAIRDYAYTFFKKQFDFLQIKDPCTYAKIVSLGQELTEGDRDQLWVNIKNYQEKTLKDKRIKHRNFGIYSKHECGYEDCCYNGFMIRQNSVLVEDSMRNKNYDPRIKSERALFERKNSKLIIKDEMDLESL